MRFLITLALCACLASLSGCCSADPAPAAPAYGAGMDLQPVIAQPVSGVCIEIPIIGCKVCLGVDCTAPEIITPAVFGQPVVAPAAPSFGSPDPCAEVYAAPADPCGSDSDGYCPDCDVPAWGSASDADAFDYGTPPAMVGAR